MKEEENEEAAIRNSPELKEFIQKLASKGYFANTVEGTPEYEDRLNRAVQKYIDRVKSSKTTESAPAPRPETSTPTPTHVRIGCAFVIVFIFFIFHFNILVDGQENVIERADKYKDEGNDHFRNGRYMQAYSSYSDALNVSEFNPNNYIYYCNRATASFYMKNYDDVINGMF